MNKEDYLKNRKKYPNLYKVACELAKLSNPQAVISLIAEQCSDNSNKSIRSTGINIFPVADKTTSD